MIDVTEAEDGVLEVVVRDTVTEADIETALAAFRPRLESGAPIVAYIDMADMVGFTMNALSRDIQEGLKLMPYWGAQVRYALVTDSDFLAAMAHFKASVLPNYTLRVFPSSERTTAREWIAQTAPRDA